MFFSQIRQLKLNEQAIMMFTESPLIPGNKIMFKRTRSLSNAVCFKHDNNVCACAVIALILHEVENLPPEIDSQL